MEIQKKTCEIRNYTAAIDSVYVKGRKNSRKIDSLIRVTQKSTPFNAAVHCTEATLGNENRNVCVPPHQLRTDKIL